MTEAERTILRQRIAATAETERLCAYCHQPIPAERIGRGRFLAIYCNPTHRKYGWRQTESGRQHEREAWRRRYRREQATA